MTSLILSSPLLNCQTTVCTHVSIFTSVVRAIGTIIFLGQALVRYCHYGISTVNYSDSDSESVDLHDHQGPVVQN